MKHLASAAWHAFKQDLRLSEVRLLMASLALAVAAVCSVGFLVDRFEAGLRRDAAQLLGGDVVLASDHKINESARTQAGQLGLKVASTASFPSMISAGDAAVLVAAKAVSDGYPLRGKLTVMDASGRQEEVSHGPPRGELWVDDSLLAALNLKLGDSLQLGSLRLQVTRSIVLEPDRGAQFASFAPRAMFNEGDLPATELVQEGSRIQWRMLFAGEPAAASQLRARLESGIERGQRVESLESGRPEMQQTLDRAQRFLSLVALVAALIASVAVFLAAREYARRQQQSIAIRRALGMQGGQILAILSLEFAIAAGFACLAGAVLGFAVHWVLASLLQGLVGVELPWPTLRPLAIGVAIGAVLTAGVVLPRVAQLRLVPTLAVIRHEDLPLQRGTLGAYLLAGGGVFLLLVLSVRDTTLALGVAGGFAAGAAVFALLVRAAVMLLVRLRGSVSSFGLRNALAACARRTQGVVVQTLALSIGLMAIALLVLIRSDLIDAWKKSVPVDAPNRFVINIQPDQTADFSRYVTDLGLPAPALSPMIRARLVARNGQAIGPQTYADERAKRLVDREFNASYAKDLPAHNRLAQGKWFAPESAEVSMESGIMKTLDLKLGDRLSFEVAGESHEVLLTSSRDVAWDSLKVNFFAIGSPGAFGNLPQSFITALNVPDDKARAFQAAVKVFPNLTIVDTRAVIAQVQSVLSQVIRAVEFLFLFAMAAGVAVLFVATTATRDERRRESAVMRALGASGAQIRNSHAWEFLIIGAIAGTLAAVGASLLAWAIGKYAFNFVYVPSPWVAASTVLVGMLVTLAGGWWAVRRAVNAPPVVTLREAL